MFKVLIGEISSNKAIVIAKYLKSHYRSVEVYSYDYKSFTKYISTKYIDKHYILKKRNTEQYIEDLASLIIQVKVDLFIPVHSDFIGLILRNKHKFNDTLFYLGDYKVYDLLHTKNRLQDLARKLSIETPLEYPSFNDAIPPFVAKPINKSSSKGVLYINNEAQKEKYSQRDYTNYIFQSYIVGYGCGYSVYSKDGDIISGYAHKRLAEYPVSGGSSVYRTDEYDKEMKAITSKILFEVKWTGFAMFEFKCTNEGRYVLIEVNPRIWGSINQGLQNDINFFEHLVPLKPLNKENIHKVNTYISPQIYLAFFNYVLKGDMKKIFYFIKQYKQNKVDVSILDDFKGWLSVLLRYVCR